MRPSLRQIEAFLAVAETGSFSRAATRLGGTQPGISQAVRELEALLELRLFDRTTRRVVLTTAGEVFRDGALKGMEALDQALTELAAEDELAAKVVELRYFAGLGHEQIAEFTGVSVYEARKKWTYARAWLRERLSDS